jgi:Transposase DDE domain
VTDPDSRNLKTTRGWVQGYNAQAVVTQEQIMIAAEISVESLDTANLRPMVETARAGLNAAGIEVTPGVVLADAGYWKNEAIEALVAQGVQTLVAPDADKRKEPRPGRRGGLYDFTRRVLASDWGAELYLKRQGTVEPVFGRSSQTAAPTASYVVAPRQSGPSGACWAPPTTSSSSTSTNSPPAEPPGGDRTLRPRRNPPARSAHRPRTQAPTLARRR